MAAAAAAALGWCSTKPACRGRRIARDEHPTLEPGAGTYEGFRPVPFLRAAFRTRRADRRRAPGSARRGCCRRPRPLMTRECGGELGRRVAGPAGSEVGVLPLRV